MNWRIFLAAGGSASLECFAIPLGLASPAWIEALVATGLALLGSIVLVALLHPYLLKLPDALM